MANKFELESYPMNLLMGTASKCFLPIEYGIGALHTRQDVETRSVWLTLEWCTRGGELQYFARGEILYEDLYRQMSFVKVLSNVFYMKLDMLVDCILEQMSDGGLTKAQIQEMDEIRAEARELEQWCVV